MSERVPKIEPIKVKLYEVKQSKYNQVSRIPTSNTARTIAFRQRRFAF